MNIVTKFAEKMSEIEKFVIAHGLEKQYETVKRTMGKRQADHYVELNHRFRVRLEGLEEIEQMRLRRENKQDDL